ncbi:hypothetical protein JAU75_01630 [Ochrobactrum sp. Q0168]|uniref:hypothetical protein n=1 Tax=Ochrobactrum sp. Q0168 TaxID=2793241 RepID=UPI0018EB20C6|nr:hypothetical protein [Ochrobactrum sp. Q0168]
MTNPNNITVRFLNVEISGAPEAVLRFVKGWQQPEEKPQPWWVTETPWFERHGKLTPEEAADLEAGTYGTRDNQSNENPQFRFFPVELSDKTIGKLTARAGESARKALKDSIADDAGYREAKRKLFAASREALDRNLRR